ncbi:MAG: VOC family protein [Deltaproteobacteria bacterium]|nr:VOC family protein [Deltaproteobacteria bacterium]
MPIRGPLSHIDLTIRDPDRSIPFYAAFFEALGWRRFPVDLPDFQGPAPKRAAWFTRYGTGSFFGIEVRPASEESRDQKLDRYAPGLHHMAFHAESAEDVDRVHRQMLAAGATVLDAPAGYGGQPGYGDGYYAAFYADPDGLKLEVVYEPVSNP